MKRSFAIILCLLIFLSDQAKATVVFTDSFTVGADVNLDAYPSTPDYAMNVGASTDLKVIAATDNLQAQINTVTLARMIDGSAPTGDQQITASLVADGGSLSLAVRVDTGGAFTCYLGWFLPSGGEIRIYRIVDGGYTEAATCTGLTFGDSFTGRVSAVGSGATVTVEAQADSQTTCSLADTDASRITSGVPGFSTEGSNVATYDNVSVDDLTAASTPAIISILSRRRR